MEVVPLATDGLCLLEIPDELILHLCEFLLDRIDALTAFSQVCCRVRTLLGTVSGTGLFRRCAEKQLHRSLVLLHVADAERILPGVSRRAVWWRKLSALAQWPFRWTATAVPLQVAPATIHGSGSVWAPHTARSGHTVTVLESGAALVLGGITMDTDAVGLVLEPLILFGDTVYPVYQRIVTVSGVQDMAPEVSQHSFGSRVGMAGPAPRLRHAVCLIRPATVLIYGGMDVFRPRVFDDLWMCDVEGDPDRGYELLWQRVEGAGPESESPGPRCQHSLTATPTGHAILFGGRDFHCSSSVHMLDLTTWKWKHVRTTGGDFPSTIMGPFPSHRVQLHCAVISRARNALVVFGGGPCDTLMDGELAYDEPPFGATRMEVHALDLETFAWSRHNNYRSAGDCCGGGDTGLKPDHVPLRVERAAFEMISPRHAVVTGGHTSATGRLSNEFLVLDLDSLDWTRATFRDQDPPASAGACFAQLSAFSGLDPSFRAKTRLLRFRLPTSPLRMPTEPTEPSAVSTHLQHH